MTLEQKQAVSHAYKTMQKVVLVFANEAQTKDDTLWTMAFILAAITDVSPDAVAQIMERVELLKQEAKV